VDLSRPLPLGELSELRKAMRNAKTELNVPLSKIDHFEPQSTKINHF
jgi:hypothetical protein